MDDKINELLTTVAFKLTDLFDNEANSYVHPGPLSAQERKDLKNESPVVYTGLLKIENITRINSGEVELPAQLVSLILNYDVDAGNREEKIHQLVADELVFLNCQQWELTYVRPVKDEYAFDLHGLLRKPDLSVGDVGWDPTLQARVIDLTGELSTVEEDPKFSIWAITWTQPVRLGVDVYAGED